MPTELKDLQEFFQHGPIQKLNPTGTIPLMNPVQNQSCRGWVPLKETMAHRTIAEMSARGYTNKEIAAELGRSPCSVSMTLNQQTKRGIQAEICARVAADVDREAMEFVKAEIIPSLRTLKMVRDNPNGTDSARIAAAQAFIERRYGKANQPINKDSSIDLDGLAIADIAKQLPQTERTGDLVQEGGLARQPLVTLLEEKPQ
jgi:hypothetical protein